MKYTEEEKKAIKEIENFIFEVRNFGITSKDSLYVKYSEFLLKLVEKQQKEIERLLKDNYRLDRENQLKFEKAVDTSDYVSKNEIREKIKDLRYNESLGFEQSFEETFKIEVLEELLGGK